MRIKFGKPTFSSKVKMMSSCGGSISSKVGYSAHPKTLPTKRSSRKDKIIYSAWWCPNEPKGHFCCEKATQIDIDKHLKECHNSPKRSNPFNKVQGKRTSTGKTNFDIYMDKELKEDPTLEGKLKKQRKIMEKEIEEYKKKKSRTSTWEGSEAQKKYWNSLKGLKNDKAPNWRGDKVKKHGIHNWLEVNFGKPKICDNANCKGKCKTYDWCLKRGKDYERNRNYFLRMCRSCHRSYDLTPIKKSQAIKNLWWSRGLPNPTQKYV